MVPLPEIGFITAAYNQFLSLFPAPLQGLVSLIVLIALAVGFIKLIRYHWLFILVLIILVPLLIPVFRSFFLGIWQFALFLWSKAAIFLKGIKVNNSLRY